MIQHSTSRRWPPRIELGVLIAIFLLSGLGTWWAGDNATLSNLWSFADILGAMVFVLVAHRRSGNGWDVLGLGRPRRWWLTLVVALPLAYVMLILAGLFQMFVVANLTGGAPDLSRFDMLRGNPVRLAFGLLSVWITAAFGEELVMRGFFMERVARLLGGGRRSWWIALLASSVTFGLIHLYQGPSGVLLIGFVGLLQGTLYLVSGRNLWLCILVHGLLDTFSLLMLYFNVQPTVS